MDDKEYEKKKEMERERIRGADGRRKDSFWQSSPGKTTPRMQFSR